MSRSGYSDSCEGWELIRWRGAVRRAIRGERGQKFIKDLIAALDAMPEKALITEDLQDEHGDVCAMGAVGKMRGVDMSEVDPDERDEVGKLFNIAPALAAEISYENDEPHWHMVDRKYVDETPEQRWTRMRAWAERQLAEQSPAIK